MATMSAKMFSNNTYLASSHRPTEQEHLAQLTHSPATDRFPSAKETERFD